MSDLFGNHIVGFPTRRLIFCSIIYLIICRTKMIEIAQLTSSRDSQVLIVFFRLIIEHSMQFVLMTTLIINALTAHCEVENIFVDAAFFLKAISI